MSCLPTSFRVQHAVLIAAALSASSCGNREPRTSATGSPSEHVGSDPRPENETPVAPVIEVSALPHDHAAFTQGLAFWQGRLFEGTGLHGESTIRELNPDTGQELRRATLDPKYFGEGITVLNGRLYQLTWQEHTCFVYDAASFNKLDELTYEGEGWGLTDDGTSLITSDGSEWIRYRDATSFKVTRSIRVTLAGQPVQRLNELEYIKGEIWANIWYSPLIVRISPADGHVIAMLDGSKIIDSTARSSDADEVMNGIAFDAVSGTLLITGKRWPTMYKVERPR